MGLWCLVRFGRVRQRQLRSRPQHLRNQRASHQNGDRTIDRVLKEHACRLPGEEPFPIREKGVGIPGALGNAPRFRARPRTTAPRGPLPQAHRSPVPDPAGAKRPAGRCPGALGPRRAWDQRGTVAGAMDPATAAVKGLLSMRAETGNALRFPRPRGTVPQRPVQPAPTEASARRGRGGRWPGALGPRRAWDQRGAVAGAMAPAIEAVEVLSFGRAGTGNAPRFPARAGRFPADRQVQAQRRPAPDPAGEKRPLGAGRALAGGFGPPAGQGSAGRCGRGDCPCHGSRAGGSDDVLPPPVRAGPGNALRFPRPRATLHPRLVQPAPREASARPGGREAPAMGGAGAGRGLWAPGWPGINVALWQGRWPLPLQRGWWFGL